MKADQTCWTVQQRREVAATDVAVEGSRSGNPALHARSVSALGLALALSAFSGEANAQQVFATNLPIATGIEADRSGNVYVDSDATWTTHVTKFSPAGTISGRTQLGGITVGNLGRIARVPNSDNMLLVTNRGMIYSFGPSLQLSPYLDLGPLNFAVANNVYDVNTGRFVSFTLGAPTWGDIASYWARNDLLYVYISGTTGAAGGFPFVLRLDLDFTRGQIFWRVVAKSTGTTAGNVNQPRGVAVNSAGWVLTGFPFAIPPRPELPDIGGFADSVVAFRTSFPETRTTAEAPRFLLRTNQTRTGVHDLASFGMTTDAAGNFYVASGVVGSSLCGFGSSSALVVINNNPTTPNPRCVRLPAFLTGSNDVAVSPVGNIPYMTVGSQVVRFNRLVSTASAPASARAVGALTPAEAKNNNTLRLSELQGAQLTAR